MALLAVALLRRLLPRPRGLPHFPSVVLYFGQLPLLPRKFIHEQLETGFDVVVLVE